MSEKFYIVSESELERLIKAWAFMSGPDKLIATTQASNTCRARPVYHSNFGPAFVPIEGYWFEVKK